MTEKRSRLKSWALWLAVGSLAVMVVKEFSGMDISGNVENIMNAVLPVLVGFGIINNPTDAQKV